MNEIEFRTQLKQQGFDEPEVLQREANLTNAEHTHDFTASALVLDGEVSVISASGTTTCHAGDTFTLASGTPHHEQYGSQGARFLVARRTP
jgi:quercetin dioxygenase-like cupin family protein